MAYGAGEVLGGRFEVVGELGQGGMATVYLVKDLVRQERVALKVLHAHLAKDASMQARLRTELKAAERISHPGALVPRELHNLGDGQLALSMPYHPGRTLAEVVGSDGPLSVDQARRLGARLAEVLAEAHRHGIVHRDLTPHNVMIDDRGAPVLTDFGLARMQDGGTRKSTGLMGTTGYVAPEVFEGRRRDPLSDLYGLGGVLTFALTGREPFEGAHAAAVLQRQLAGEHLSVSDHREDVPEWFADLIDGLLAVRPEERPQGAHEVVEALQLQLSGRSRAPAVPTSVEPQGAPAPDGAAGSRPWLTRPTALPSLPLPTGGYTVEIGITQQILDRLRLRRRLQKVSESGPGLLSDLVKAGGKLQDALAESGLPVLNQDPLEQLRGQLADLAGVPLDQVSLPRVVETGRVRLVAGVSEEVAHELAARAKELGFRASVYDSRPPDKLQIIARGGWAGYPIIWLLWVFSTQLGLPFVSVAVPIVLTVLWSAFVGPLIRGAERQRASLELPLAYSVAGGGELGSTTSTPMAAPLAETVPAEVEAPTSPGGRLGRRARQELAALAETLTELADELPEPVLMDLRRHHAALSEAVEGLVPQVGVLEGELGGMEASDDEDVSWMAARLQRLDTLEAAGETVDPGERARLERSLAAHAAAARDRVALESDLTSAMAALLELSAAASRARRQLADPDQLRVSAPRLAEELDQKLAAMAAARRELAR